jgi:hypothetical protein
MAALSPASARAIVLDLIERHELNLKVVAVDLVEADPDYGRLVRVFYTAPARVDFRALVVDLARALRCRIDMRQIGDREAAGRVGGAGVCGLCLCCASWLDRPSPVPVSLTRSLPAAHEPERMVGCCGRLMCCLRYESGDDAADAGGVPRREVGPSMAPAPRASGFLDVVSGSPQAANGAPPMANGTPPMANGAPEAAGGSRALTNEPPDELRATCPCGRLRQRYE